MKCTSNDWPTGTVGGTTLTSTGADVATTVLLVVVGRDATQTNERITIVAQFSEANFLSTPQDVITFPDILPSNRRSFVCPQFLPDHEPNSRAMRMHPNDPRVKLGEGNEADCFLRSRRMG